MTDKKYIKRLVKTFLLSCNPQPVQFSGSLMLNNGGKVIFNVPNNLEKVVGTGSDFQEIVEK